MTFVSDIAVVFWDTLCEMAPYLIFGFIVAGTLSIVISPKLVERHLGGSGIWPVIKASFFGVPLPLCSCGVIPVAASLRRHGASKGAVTAFLLSTPQTGADSILVTFSLLGPVFAIFRPAAAFVSGLIGGSLIASIEKSDTHNEASEESQGDCCSQKDKQSILRRILHHGFVTLPRDIAAPLMIGLLIAGMISAFVPATLASQLIGTGFLSMLAMMALGMPLYVCATASIPIAVAMLAKGVTPGAALVFLMTGPATNAATIATLWKLIGRRATLVYLGTVAATALGSGLILNSLFDSIGVPAHVVSHWMLPASIKVVSAIALLAILTYAVIKKQIEKSAERRELG